MFASEFSSGLEDTTPSKDAKNKSAPAKKVRIHYSTSWYCFAEAFANINLIF